MKRNVTVRRAARSAVTAPAQVRLGDVFPLSTLVEYRFTDVLPQRHVLCVTVVEAGRGFVVEETYVPKIKQRTKRDDWQYLWPTLPARWVHFEKGERGSDDWSCWRRTRKIAARS